jgi:hypothetical protein
VNVGLALVVIGTMDCLLAVLFFWLAARGTRLLDVWPDPGPWGADREMWLRLARQVETLRVCRIVCLNTGGSMGFTGLILMMGWL